MMEVKRLKHLGVLLVLYATLTVLFFAAFGAGFMKLAQTDINNFQLYVSSPSCMVSFLAIAMILTALIYKSIVPHLKFIRENYKDKCETYVNIIILFPLSLIGATALLLFAKVDMERHLSDNVLLFPFFFFLLYGILHFSVFLPLDKTEEVVSGSVEIK